MPTDRRTELAGIKRIDQLVRYLRDRMGWPIGSGDFEELTFEYTPDELGIDAKNAAKIQEIKRLRPLSPRQPWGIFFVKFEPKRLPVVALRRILSQVALKKRASANSAERAAWAADDLLFVSNYGEGDERQISFAHFSNAQDGHDLPTLKVLGWDNLDTALHLDAVAKELTEHLAWPDDDADVETWRQRWRAAFTLRHREVVTTSKELSIRLAELARAIRDRIKTALAIETETGPLTKLMKAFQGALVHDLDADGFADMYAQTIAYGLLSARIADPHKRTSDDFAGHMRTNPFLRELMETFLKVGGRRSKAGGPGIDFDELGVSEVVELLDDANMEAVVRDFGDRNPQEDPVIHFYELFLKEYDAKKRMQRGVFYTPRPVVSYIVHSLDDLLRSEFSLEDGLADTTTWGEMAKRHNDVTIPQGIRPEQAFVQILDPATGTGTFLVEVIDVIHKTLVAKWKTQGHGDIKIEALWNEYIPKHLMTRLHGYELLMAPYAIAHLKIGLKLYETGYRFGSDERARVYLTNALEPAHDFAGRFEFAIPALAHEAQAVNEIKRKQRFTVVMGNPPYAGHSSNNSDWARALVSRYRKIENEELRLAQGKWLQNDYVKFIALAETTLALSCIGILGMITDHSYVDGDTFPGLRYALLRQFSGLEVLNLHGSLTRREAPPEKGVDENVFDIQQGVAIAIAWVRRRPHGVGSLAVADLWGDRVTNFATLAAPDCRSRRLAWRPVSVFDERYLFIAVDDHADPDGEYESYDAIDTVFAENGRPAPGFLTTHDSFAIAFTKTEIIRNVDELVGSRNEEGARQLFTLCSQEQWQYGAAKRALQKSEWRHQIRSCLYRPFDHRWTVYDPHVLVHRRERLNSHLLEPGNLALLTTRMTKGDDFRHVFVTDRITEVICLSSKKSANAFVFPLFLRDDAQVLPGMHSAAERPNIADRILSAYRAIAGNAATPRALFFYYYAVLHSPAYRTRYNARLIREFPRLPRPAHRGLLRSLGAHGEALVNAHLKGTEASHVALRGRGDNVVAAGMPRFDKEASRVLINSGQFFDGVSPELWEYKIGSYGVCEKWLKARKGRTLSPDDIAHYQKIVGALAETIRLMKEIDEVIEKHGGWPGAFQTGEAKAEVRTVIPFPSRIVTPTPAERYVTCVPLVPLKAAAGAFGDPQHIQDDDWDWIAVETKHRLRPGMFVAQVVGRSMEPMIPDGSYCLFTAPVEGTRQGKIVLVQMREATDPESGERYTVKRYESEKAEEGDSWHHAAITLNPLNPDFEPIVLTRADDDQFRVVAELVEVLAEH